MLDLHPVPSSTSGKTDGVIVIPVSNFSTVSNFTRHFIKSPCQATMVGKEPDSAPLYH